MPSPAGWWCPRGDNVHPSGCRFRSMVSVPQVTDCPETSVDRERRGVGSGGAGRQARPRPADPRGWTARGRPPAAGGQRWSAAPCSRYRPLTHRLVVGQPGLPAVRRALQPRLEPPCAFDCPSRAAACTSLALPDAVTDECLGRRKPDRLDWTSGQRHVRWQLVRGLWKDTESCTHLVATDEKRSSGRPGRGLAKTQVLAYTARAGARAILKLARKRQARCLSWPAKGGIWCQRNDSGSP
jgi:hypothetical protein